ncbi:MAG: hypothetical protein QOG62_474 [Thermoleophilaceae bacterium]|jgi:uncharacterized membrane protein YcaP (DUF421 family)|nr:hypothetical protein [Thermoleophilaceae bacterium]
MDIVIRAAVIFFLILLLTRVVGRRELNSLEPFDLIMLVVIGDLVQQGVTQQDNSLTGGALAIVTIGLLTVATAYVNFRFRPMRRVLEGQPVVLVSDGEVLERNLRRERLTVGELESEARLQQVSSLADVRFAVLETSGRISVIPKG